jgi:hypothetical protein
VEAHQSSSKVKQFFRQGEMSTLLKDCKNGLTQGFDFFWVSSYAFQQFIANNSACIAQEHGYNE